MNKKEFIKRTTMRGHWVLDVEPSVLQSIKVGCKIIFQEDKRPYTVMARNDRFIICTKPFNLKKTVLYTIIDLQRGCRGTENLIFCMGFETKELCDEALKRLADGESEVSYRNCVKLNINNVIP